MADSQQENGLRPRPRPRPTKAPDEDDVLEGWHFWLVILALCLALLLSTLETTIIATALIDISSSLGDFGKSNWIVIAYLLTYTGNFRRLLIVFRAFQGIGGSGIYGMVMAISPEITPAAKFGLVSGCISAVFASSSILGPIIGGAITSTTTWRWVFYLKSGFLTGFPFMVIIIFLPQRFQIENGLSPVDAGVKMLALLLLSAFGAGLAGFICSKKNISWYLLVLSNVLQIIGLGLLSSVPNSETILARQYGYQVILGLGFGLSLSSLVIVTRVEVSDADLAVTMGAITQVRVLGGVVGVAIAQVILSSSVRADLPSFLSPEQVEQLLSSASSIAQLEPDQILAVRKAYGDAYNQQTRMVMYFAIASLAVALLAFRKDLRSFADAGKDGNRLSTVGNRLSMLSDAGVMVGGGGKDGGTGSRDGRGVRSRSGRRIRKSEYADDVALVNPPPSQTSLYSTPQRPKDTHIDDWGSPHLDIDVNQSSLSVDFMKRFYFGIEHFVIQYRTPSPVFEPLRSASNVNNECEFEPQSALLTVGVHTVPTKEEGGEEMNDYCMIWGLPDATVEINSRQTCRDMI
ncbi:MAG: hypothetical protein Q9216_001819 [Gyalolechia sp. 2 TL-2023]